MTWEVTQKILFCSEEATLDGRINKQQVTEGGKIPFILETASCFIVVTPAKWVDIFEHDEDSHDQLNHAHNVSLKIESCFM